MIPLYSLALFVCLSLGTLVVLRLPPYRGLPGPTVASPIRLKSRHGWTIVATTRREGKDTREPLALNTLGARSGCLATPVLRES